LEKVNIKFKKTGTQKLYFEYDEQIILTSEFLPGKFTIIPVNYWNYPIPKLEEIITFLKNKHPYIKVVTLQQLIFEHFN